MNAKQKLKEIAEIINNEIEILFDNEFVQLAQISKFSNEMVTNIKQLIMGGKRLRGAFIYYSYLMYGGKNKKEILKAAAFIEAMQTYILMIDDVIDRDEKRRGVITLNKFYKDFHINNNFKNDSTHFGNSLAICSALIVNHKGVNFLLNSEFDKYKIIKALECFNNSFVYTGFGEILDVLVEVKEDVSLSETIDIMLYKTAMYTYESPLQIGAILAEANENDLKTLSEYAIPAGIAFQIQDDILGIFGNDDITGKPSDGDIKEGKMNMLTVKTLELLDNKDKKIFKELFGNKDINHEQIMTVKTMIKNSGAYEFCKNQALEYVKKAKKNIHNLPDSEGKDFLISIAEYMINREL